MSYILSNTNIFLEEFSAKKINNLQMYRYNAFDMSQVIIVENEMKIWTWLILLIYYVNELNEWQNNRN